MNDQSASIDRAVRSIFSDSDLHANTTGSIANAVVGAVFAAQAGIASIGRAMATALDLNPKHAIKQFDRLLSNSNFDLDRAFHDHIKFVVGSRWKVVVALDWTDYEGGNQHRINLSLTTRHGRATPLLWKSVPHSALKDHRNDYEDELLRQFKRLLPSTVKRVTVLADRGFGDVDLYDMLQHELGFDYVIRFRAGLVVRDEEGTANYGRQWVPSNGRARLLPNAEITNQRYRVPAVVAVKAARMKDSWLLATSLPLKAAEIVSLYGKRFSIEENFRDEKDWRFGLGSRWVNIAREDRRDRLCFVLALACILMTLLGQSGEELGLDRSLRANTVRRRTHSLFRQGREYLRGAIGKLAHAPALLWRRFVLLVAAQPQVAEDWGII